ncbi:uncharacterized protein LOC124888856 [Capsicum annuum]|uniref:uncharacterized protein LOC124888856 n=1 Tax=Capsicum annuum TaxID=4072 RepID=UPI001FB17B6B|nr:uncharacterized protein LOC124888856 [Capsicum annuum]
MGIEKINFEWSDTVNLRMSMVIELEEFRLRAYDISALYKEKMNLYHHKKIEKRVFNLGNVVLLYNSRIFLFLGKLKSTWHGPFTVVSVFPYSAFDLKRDREAQFKVNGQHYKNYIRYIEEVKVSIEFKARENTWKLIKLQNFDKSSTDIVAPKAA